MAEDSFTGWKGDPPTPLPEPDEFIPFAQQLHAESDRGMALSGTAYLDDRLARLIEAYLVEEADGKALLWGGSAPVGTFSARIALAHALGLIGDDERKHLNMLRKVRNLFAHNFQTKIADQVVVDTMGNFHELVDISGSIMDDTLDVKFAETPRDRFFHAVLRLAQQLDSRIYVVGSEEIRLKKVMWYEYYL